MTCVHPSRWAAVAVACAVAVATTAAEPEFSIKLPNKTYAVGDRVTAEVTGAGELLLENDLKQASEKVTLSGKTRVELGVVREPGVFVVRARMGKTREALVLVAAPAAKGLDVSASVAPVSPPELPKGAVEKFLTGVTAARAKDAVTRAARKWLPKNVAGLGTTSTVCLVCLVPGTEFACGACLDSAAGNAADLGVETLSELIGIEEAAGELTKAEADKLRLFVKLGNGVFKMAHAGGALERLIEGCSVETLGGVGASNGS